MTQYEVKFNFGSDVGHDEVNAWFETLKDAMPEGTEGTISSTPHVIEVENLTDAYIGHTVRTYIPKIKTTIEGKLEKVYPADRDNGLWRTMIVDGIAYTTLYGTVEVLDW